MCGGREAAESGDSDTAQDYCRRSQEGQAQTVLVDKLTAAQIHVELLIKQLRGGVRRRGR